MDPVSCEEKPSFHICQPTVKGGQDQLQLSLQQQIWSGVEGHNRPQLTPAEAQPSQNIPRPMTLPIPNHTQHHKQTQHNNLRGPTNNHPKTPQTMMTNGIAYPNIPTAQHNIGQKNTTQ